MILSVQRFKAERVSECCLSVLVGFYFCDVFFTTCFADFCLFGSLDGFSVIRTTGIGRAWISLLFAPARGLCTKSDSAIELLWFTRLGPKHPESLYARCCG